MIGIILLPLFVAQAKSSLPTPVAPPLTTNAQIGALEKSAGLPFDAMFPRRSFFGKSASGLEWSKDDRYLVYLWNPIKERGNDLYLYDTKSGTSTRLTKPDTWLEFDRNIPKALEQNKKEDDELDKADKMSDLEYREWRLKRKEEAAKRKEPLPSYPGVSAATWSPKSDELLVTYAGDIYRWKLGEAKPTRLTNTRDREGDAEFTPDASGFTFARGNAIYRARFDSPIVEQLNPELPDRLEMAGYQLSPDGTKMMVRVDNWTQPNRTVQWISFKDRFAKAVTVNRGVADDEFKIDSRVYLYDITQGRDPKNDGKPWEVWTYKGGKEWQQTSIVNGRGARGSDNQEFAWSKDSKKFVFATWRRTAMEYEIKVADLEKKELTVAYKAKLDGDHDTPGMSQPFFTPDGSKIIAMLDISGYRHPWIIDPVKQTASPITKGAFDCYPVRITPDGKSLFVTANPVTAPVEGVFRVDIESGEMKQIGKKTGVYENTAFSESTNQLAANFKSWSSPSELYVLDGDEKKVTDSHRGTFDAVNKEKPNLFTFQNRNGQTVHGYMFLPDNFKKTDKRPLFMYVYGGPLGKGNSVEVGTFNTTAYLFNQYLTRVFGYVTIVVDPRGSSGYGNAFGNANWEKPGQAQVEDLSDAAKYMAKEYGIDTTKVGINGWSFGGFQTQMCLFTAPDVFTLGIAGAGPTEWQNYNTWYTAGVIGASPSGSPADLDKYSLTSLAKNLRSPLMLLHGMEDDNVLFQDTVNVYRKLLQYGRGPLVELALDPTGGHGMGGDMDSRDRHAIYLGFLNKWWGPYKK